MLQFTRMDSSLGIIGHEWAVETLKRGLASNTISHAYLFTGLPGVGKTSLAKVLAKMLLCQAEEDPRPCDTCRACQMVDRGQHPDLHMIASERVGDSLKIDQIRDVQHQLSLTPMEGAWRVAILRRFQEATPSAANALLKTLEEPPGHVVMIVLATDADQLLSTIVSRCQHIHLNPLAKDVIKQALIKRWQVDPQQAELLAHLAGGRLGWAVTALNDKSRLEMRAQRLEDLQHLIHASATELLQFIEKVARDPVATQETIDLWISWWRDVLLLASGSGESLSNVDYEDRIGQHARQFGIQRSAAMLQSLRKANQHLKRNANTRLTLEVLVLDLPHA